jgi:hypothetical protein
MGLIRCTQKVLTEMGLKASSLGPDQDPDEELALWYANLIYLSRKKTLIFTNPATCFSLIVPCVNREGIKKLSNIFIHALALTLKEEGVEEEITERIVALFRTTEIGKTKDRRPLGVMNDLAKHIQAHLDFDYGGDPFLLDGLLVKKLNRIPWSGLAFCMATEHFGRLLKERYSWKGDFKRL